jgi:hypothetical protein
MVSFSRGGSSQRKLLLIQQKSVATENYFKIKHFFLECVLLPFTTFFCSLKVVNISDMSVTSADLRVIIYVPTFYKPKGKCLVT